MTHNNKLSRVRIVHDSCPEDPRNSWDLVCEIADVHHQLDVRAYVTNLITHTKGFKVAELIVATASGDDQWYSPLSDLIEDDDDVRRTWLEQLKPELLVKEFWSGYRDEYKYVAHTTPDMCAKLGVDWSKAEEAMDSEIETFCQWADGDVYGYVIEAADPPEDPDDEPEWEETDSCWGFYGSDPFKNGMDDHVPEELHDMLRRAEVEYEY